MGLFVSTEVPCAKKWLWAYPVSCVPCINSSLRFRYSMKHQPAILSTAISFPLILSMCLSVVTVLFSNSKALELAPNIYHKNSRNACFPLYIYAVNFIRIHLHKLKIHCFLFGVFKYALWLCTEQKALNFVQETAWFIEFSFHHLLRRVVTSAVPDRRRNLSLGYNEAEAMLPFVTRETFKSKAQRFTNNWFPQRWSTLSLSCVTVK